MRVPGYEVDGLLFFKNHFEGGYLFRDMVMLEATPPADGTMASGRSNIGSRTSAIEQPQTAAIVDEDDDVLTFEIPIEQPHPPGIKARLRVETQLLERLAVSGCHIQSVRVGGAKNLLRLKNGRSSRCHERKART